MNPKDVEWYLEAGGARSGPYSARQILEMHEKNQILSNAMVTTPRMQGDWVTVGDLLEAYRELTSKRDSQIRTGTDFQPPPRPVEQLEASKIINLNPNTEGSDATDTLFAAIQMIREKSQKGATAAAVAVATKDSFGEVKRIPQRVPPQLVLIATLAVILGITVYGIGKIVANRSAKNTEAASGDAKASRTAPPAAPTAATGARLLSPGGAPGSVNTRPPVRANPFTGGGAMRIGDTPRHDTHTAPRHEENARDRNEEAAQVDPSSGGAAYDENRGEAAAEGAAIDSFDGGGARIPTPVPIDPTTGQPNPNYPGNPVAPEVNSP